MGKLILRIVINAVALWVAAYLVPGIGVTDQVTGLLIAALVFGIVNALIKPIVSIISCPITILTLGLFTLVINALMLLLTGYLVPGLSVDGFVPALIGGLVIGIVSTLLSFLLVDNDSKK